MQNNIRKTNTMEFTCRIIKLIDNNELNMQNQNAKNPKTNEKNCFILVIL